MPRSNKLINYALELQKKSNKKIKGQAKRHGSMITPEFFGVDSDLFNRKPQKTDSYYQVKKFIKFHEDFNSKTPKYRVTNISREGGSEPVVLSEKQRYIEKAKEINDYYYKYYKLVTSGKYNIAEKSKKEGLKITPTSNKLITSKLISSITPIAHIKGANWKVFGDQKVAYINDRPALTRANRRLEDKAYRNKTKAHSLRRNYIKGLENSFSTYFAEEIDNLLKQLKVSDAEFVYLFYHYEVFDFGFIYSSSDLNDKQESIKTVIQHIHGDEKVKSIIKDFAEQLSNLEKTI